MKPESNYAPVALFVYNRPYHTQQTIEALLANPEAAKTDLYIFSDAPKQSVVNTTDVLSVRSYIETIKGFKSVSIIKRGINFGLAKSIIEGVTQVCQQYGRVIVLEDDIVTSEYFLSFMNKGLDVYAEDKHVISISAYVYPIAGLPDIFFIRGADCWGWATWNRAWQCFEHDGRILLQGLKEKRLMYLFDSNGTYPFSKMLKHQICGKNNSWAIRWHATAVLKNKYTLYPSKTLVHNIGIDGSGVNCSSAEDFTGEIAISLPKLRKIPVVESPAVRLKIMKFHQQLGLSLPMKIYKRLKSLLVKSSMLKFIREYILRQQYNPTIVGLWLNPFYHSRHGLRIAIKRMAGYINVDRILDVGCGKKPYRDLFSCKEYIGLEIDTPNNRANKQADFFYNGTTFPFYDTEFDAIVCNQVLEHVFTPDIFLCEIKRVLKKDGLLLLTVPFVWDEHEQPWDYARYSSFGLKSLLQKNGFKVLQYEKTSANISVVFQLLNAYLYKILWTRWSLINLCITFFLLAPFNVLGLILGKVLPSNQDLYLDQIVLAQRIEDD